MIREGWILLKRDEKDAGFYCQGLDCRINVRIYFQDKRISPILITNPFLILKFQMTTTNLKLLDHMVLARNKFVFLLLLLFSSGVGGGALFQQNELLPSSSLEASEFGLMLPSDRFLSCHFNTLCYCKYIKQVGIFAWKFCNVWCTHPYKNEFANYFTEH